MPFFDGTREILLFVFSAVAGTTVSFGVFDRWRGRRRNAQGECARCGRSWSSLYPSIDRFLVQGRHVCEPCADALRARLPKLVKILIATGLIGASWIVFEFGIGNRHGSLTRWLLGLSGPVGLTAATYVGLLWAKRQNRAALRDSRVRTLAQGEEVVRS
jgi:hypothetical protein